MVKKIRLFVNVDHVATIREARKTVEPDPLEAALLAEKAGAEYVKTCTGFGPRGATPEDIDTMLNATNLPVKASGGIKTLAQAEAYLDQGCKRLGIGLESAKHIMKELVC